MFFLNKEQHTDFNIRQKNAGQKTHPAIFIFSSLGLYQPGTKLRPNPFVPPPLTGQE